MAYIVTCKKCGQGSPPPFWTIEPYGRCCMDCAGVLWSDYELARDIVFGLPDNGYSSNHVDDVALKIAKYRKKIDAE